MDEIDLLNLLCGVRTENVLLGHLRDWERQAIGAYSSEVWLSRYTVIKLEAKHKDVTLYLYRIIPTVLRVGIARWLPPRQLVFLYSTETEPPKAYRLFVKATRGGAQVFLTTIHRIRHDQIEATIARTRPIPPYGIKESA